MSVNMFGLRFTTEGGGDPETPRHIQEFRVGTILDRGHRRLERHAADGTGAGSIANDLGMHRARAGRAGRRGRLGNRRTEVLLRISLEAFETAFPAEVIGMAAILEVAGGALGRHRHPADRIHFACGLRRRKH
jgi:hypothetical protein